MCELSLANRKRDDKAKQRTTQGGKSEKKRKHKLEEAIMVILIRNP